MKTDTLARWCSWHDGPIAPIDAVLEDAGATVTHGICESCLERLEEQIEGEREQVS